MINIETFTFNPFQENTYILYNSTGQAIVVDPGCSNSAEQNELLNFIQSKKLTLVDCWLTHAHIDHVLGCYFISNTFGLSPKLHADDLFIYNNTKQIANMYGIPFNQGPEPVVAFSHGQQINALNTVFQVLHIPGHAPGHVGFYLENQEILISGDVLFKQSIGRTDLPGGSMDVLIQSIKTQLYTLPNQTLVHPGHGPTTTIGYEKQNNPFVKG
ncbi:MAG: MBL fold metallo-hydrolase [Luteibaculaceae bacterium]